MTFEYLLSALSWSVIGFILGVHASPSVTVCVRVMFRQDIHIRR